MKQKETRRHRERQLALLHTIRRGSFLTAAELMERIPAYAEAGIDLRTFQRDIDALREAGYPIIFDDRWRYSYDSAAPVLARVTGIGAGVLHALRSSVEAGDPQGESARLGVAKLLAGAPPESGDAAVPTHLRVRIPGGAVARVVARALQYRRRVSFDYRRGADLVKHYEVEPWNFAEHYGMFYVSGLARSRESGGKDFGPWAERTFRLSRVISGTLSVGERCEFPRGEVSGEHFDVDIILHIRDGAAAALAARGEKLSRGDAPAAVDDSALADVPALADTPAPAHAPAPAGWTAYRFSTVGLNRIFEYLAFYGVDVRLAAPSELREEWERRVDNLINLGESAGPEAGGAR
ncbi:helix-turn-helix transcriptional regulator [Actinotignum sp. GS-2025b]|uniref:helix-turn-helix transcriptional regulator n=1 Tax=Actinotignum sp. GS-2025b TaxID=3427275 RepID=UPI003F44E11C